MKNTLNAKILKKKFCILCYRNITRMIIVFPFLQACSVEKQSIQDSQTFFMINVMSQLVSEATKLAPQAVRYTNTNYDICTESDSRLLLDGHVLQRNCYLFRYIINEQTVSIVSMIGRPQCLTISEQFNHEIKRIMPLKQKITINKYKINHEKDKMMIPRIVNLNYCNDFGQWIVVFDTDL
jgi:hypothetical protein